MAAMTALQLDRELPSAPQARAALTPSLFSSSTRFQGSSDSIELWPLRDGADGTFQALDLMARATRGECPPDYSGYQDPYCVRAAMQIIGHGDVPMVGIGNDVAALFQFCRDQIEYVDHPWNVQQVQDCRRTLEMRTGDCVSKSVCLATLLLTQNLHCRFVAQSMDGEEYSHVYVEVWDGAGWLGLDPVANGRDRRPLADLGWRQTLPYGGFESTQEIF